MTVILVVVVNTWCQWTEPVLTPLARIVKTTMQDQHSFVILALIDVSQTVQSLITGAEIPVQELTNSSIS